MTERPKYTPSSTEVAAHLIYTEYSIKNSSLSGLQDALEQEKYNYLGLIYDALMVDNTEAVKIWDEKLDLSMECKRIVDQAIYFEHM